MAELIRNNSLWNLQEKMSQTKIWKTCKKTSWTIKLKIYKKIIYKDIFQNNTRMDNLRSVLQMNPKWQFTRFLKSDHTFHRCTLLKYTSSHQEQIFAKYDPNNNLRNLQPKKIWNDNFNQKMQNYPKIMQKDDWNDQDFFSQNVSIVLSGQEASRPIRDSSTLEIFPSRRCE